MQTGDTRGVSELHQKISECAAPPVSEAAETFRVPDLFEIDRVTWRSSMAQA
jgi:hypothetical protein